MAQRIEYTSMESEASAAIWTLASIFASVSLPIVAFRAFQAVSLIDVALASFAMASLPFTVDWLLKVNQTELNVHLGPAMLGFFVYGCISLVSAVIFLIAAVARSLRRRRRHNALG